MTKKQKKELVRVDISAIIIDEDTFEYDLKSSKRICNGIKVALKTNGVSMKNASVQEAACGGFYKLAFWANADDLNGIFAVAKEIGATDIDFTWSDTQ